jgi:hypothetical protein
MGAKQKATGQKEGGQFAAKNDPSALTACESEGEGEVLDRVREGGASKCEAAKRKAARKFA